MEVGAEVRVGVGGDGDVGRHGYVCWMREGCVSSFETLVAVPFVFSWWYTKSIRPRQCRWADRLTKPARIE